MELLQLRYFLEVARLQHMTRSAEKLHIAQPALTQSIRRLERDLGVDLFRHEGRNIRLTPCGELFLRRLTPIVSELDQLTEELRELAQQEARTVRLNVLAASRLVVDAIAAYKSDHEDVNFQLLQNEEGGFYDIGVSTRMPGQGTESVGDSCYICTEKILIAVPHSEPYPKGRKGRLEEFRNAPFISLFGSRQLRQICDAFCSQAGFSPKIVFESDSPAAVRDMIAEDMGVGFWPEFTWAHAETDRLQLVELTEPDCRREILITRKHHGNNPAAEAFYRFLTEYFEKQKERARVG